MMESGIIVCLQEKEMIEYTGLDYIKIDIANQMGIGGTFEAQIKWVESKINPLSQGVVGLKCLIHRAKHPARMAAAIIAYDDVVNKNIPTGHLVGLDASASGAQMMAVLISCKTTARNTGVIGSRKKDMYSIVVKEMEKILGTKVDVSRSAVKDASMPHFYGSKKQPKLVFGEGTPELAAFYQAQYKVAPGACDLLQIIKACWQPNVDEHSWVMPDGFQVRVPVIQTKREDVYFPELEAELIFQSSEVKGKPKGISLCANIVHSVDAYVMREVVKRCNFEMLVIHDEYMAHPNNMNTVRQTYADVLAEIAESDTLNNILNQIVGGDMQVDKLDKELGDSIRAANYALN